MRVAVALGFCLLILSGCVAPAVDEDQTAQQAARDDAVCRSYGTYPGTTPYVNCRLGLKHMAQERAESRSPLADLFGD